MSDATELIMAIKEGSPRALEELLPIVYQELRRLAKAQVSAERVGHTLQATALVHEAYLRLVGNTGTWDGRRHFFAAAAEAMRRILVDHARRREALKYGGGRQRIEADDEDLPVIESPCDQIDDLMALNDALDKLAARDPAKAELVKLLYFAGMNLDEAADAMGIGRSTAHRHWLYARAWLCDAMGRTPE